MIGFLTGVVLTGSLLTTWMSNETITEIKQYTERLNILAEYKENFEWKRIDYDKNGSYQCVDLVKSWYTKFTKQVAPQFKWSAYNAWKYWVSWLVKTETPIAGDIAFFKFRGRSAGHVGVFLFEKDWYVWVIDQNWWAGKWRWQWWDRIRIATYASNLVLWYKTFKINE